MKTIGGATRLAGFDKPTVWSVMTPLAVKTKSVNLVDTALLRAKDFHHGLHLLSTLIFSNNQLKHVQMT